MISDDIIQADLIYKLKQISTGTSYYGDIRELQYQSDTFSYPNLRLDLEDNTYVFDEQEKCNLQQIEFSVYVFSQYRSSKECSQIKGLVANSLIGTGFTGITTGTKYTRLRLLDNIPAFREDEHTWRSQIKFQSRVQSFQ